jgi:hypothetical protein
MSVQVRSSPAALSAVPWFHGVVAQLFARRCYTPRQGSPDVGLAARFAKPDVVPVGSQTTGFPVGLIMQPSGLQPRISQEEIR